MKTLRGAIISPNVLELLRDMLITPSVKTPIYFDTTSAPFATPCTICEKLIRTGCLVPGLDGLTCSDCTVKSYMLGLVDHILASDPPRPLLTTAQIEEFLPGCAPTSEEEREPCDCRHPDCTDCYPPRRHQFNAIPTPELSQPFIGPALTATYTCEAGTTPQTIAAQILYPHVPFVFTKLAEENAPDKPQEILMEGQHVDVMNLPAGTILRFKPKAPSEIDRTPVGPDFDINSVPLLDRDLVRRAGDPYVGQATMRPYNGTIRVVARPEFNINTLPEHERPYFTDEHGEYVPSTIVLENVEDVREYERQHSDAGIMEAIEAEERDEFGDRLVDEAINQEQNNATLRRQGKTASIALPDKCFPRLD